MIESIKQIKLATLEQLKAGRAATEAKKSAIFAQKYAEKKTLVNIEGRKLDEALDLTIKKKQAEMNEEFAKLRLEVANKKSSLDAVAKAEADAESEAEVVHALRDFDDEIAKIEKEINK